MGGRKSGQASTGQLLYNLIISRRSVRRFRPCRISRSVMKKIVNTARLAPSAANLQFLEYLVVTEKHRCREIFPLTKWAGYLYPRHTPSKEKRPSVYIIILVNNHRTRNPDLRDVGAAAENMLLALLCFGLAGCWIASIDREGIRKLIKIPRYYSIDSLIAIGKPDEDPVLEEDSNNVKYWLDEKGVFHLPKRPLKDVFHYNGINL